MRQAYSGNAHAPSPTDEEEGGTLLPQGRGGHLVVGRRRRNGREAVRPVQMPLGYPWPGDGRQEEGRATAEHTTRVEDDREGGCRPKKKKGWVGGTGDEDGVWLVKRTPGIDAARTTYLSRRR